MIWFAPFQGFGADDVVVPFPAGSEPPRPASAHDEPRRPADDHAPRRRRAPEASGPPKPSTHVPRCSIK